MNDLIRRLVASMLEQYATVLLILGAVSGLTYFVLMERLQEQEGNAILVKLSTDQGRYVSHLNFLAEKLINVKNDPSLNQSVRSQIVKDRSILNDAHIALRSGDRFVRQASKLMNVKGTLTLELRKLYFVDPVNVDKRMRDYLETVNAILKLPADELIPDAPLIKHLQYDVAPTLLDGLDKISAYHQKESEYMLGQTVNLQNLVLFISLSSLVMVGSLLLKPLVTRLKATARQMREEKAFVDNVINTAETLIVGMDTDAKIVLFNQYARSLSGWDDAEVMGGDFFEHFIPDDDQHVLRTLFADMMSGALEFASEVETQMRVRSGELINIVWHSTVVRDLRTQKPTMFLATGLDITDRKEAERSLQKAHAEMAELSSRLQAEVNLAATLQQSILPDPQIDLPGIQGKASLLTSSEVGGDYYDYFKVGGFQSVLLVGDVSGHGVAAGTMVSAAKAGIYPLIHEGVSDPAEILHSLNETMLATAHQSLLMTMACISLDARNGKLVFANAGHVLPYLWRHKERRWEMLESSGLPLGKSIGADYRTTAVELQMDVGDRLFLFTDAVIEEESTAGEPFGYDRLEHVLNQCAEVEAEVFHDYLMDALSRHCGGRVFSDDVTIMVVNHTDRVEQAAASISDVSDIVRLSDSFYRQGTHPVPRIPREYIVFVAESDYSDLLPRFSQDGICRVLPQQDDFCKKIGWDHLLNQHHQILDDDIYRLITHAPLRRQFQLFHTDDKMFVMKEIQAWLADQQRLTNDHLETLIVALDEMIENSLYAAPRDGKGVPYYEKGISRELSKHEEVRIDLVLEDSRLGLMVTDNWGTLTPAVFLKHVSHAMEGGVEAGIGGAGLYMMWRLSDYFQIRVYPQQRTQVTVLWDLTSQIDMDIHSGFQFLYHSDYDVAYQAGE
ncbi:MAG: SpoIIE family protein phosphatase [Gammaproteobacteria bacterium]